MRYRAAILDTGALVALVSRDDQYHFWATAALKNLPPILLSCEAVISELYFLLRKNKQAKQIVSDMLNSQLLKIVPMTEELPAILELIRKYDSVPMSYADSALVKLAEMTKDAVVVTTDSDFKIYKYKKNQRLPVLLPTD